MALSKPTFFAILFFLIVAPFWVVRINWVMHSVKTQGVMQFKGMGLAGDQIPPDYTVISFKAGKETIWFNGLGNLSYKRGEVIPVRFRVDDPYDARVDSFPGIWGDTLVYSGIPSLMLLIIFLHLKVVPWGSKVRLGARKPFIKVFPPV